MRVFVADDSAILRRQLIAMLSELEGVEVVGQAGRVAGALDLVRSLRPDLITLDIEMPDGNGIDLLKEIRKENLCPMVIILTGHASPPYRDKCMKAGADLFIPKAVEVDELRRIVLGLVPRFALPGG